MVNDNTQERKGKSEVASRERSMEHEEIDCTGTESITMKITRRIKGRREKRKEEKGGR